MNIFFIDPSSLFLFLLRYRCVLHNQISMRTLFFLSQSTMEKKQYSSMYILHFLYHHIVPVPSSFHKLVFKFSQACHGGWARIGFGDESVLSGLWGVGPEPPVHSLIAQISVDPVTTSNGEVVWSLGLKRHKRDGHFLGLPCKLSRDLLEKKISRVST